MVLAIGISQLYLVTSCEKPREAWDALRWNPEQRTYRSTTSSKHWRTRSRSCRKQNIQLTHRRDIVLLGQRKLQKLTFFSCGQPGHFRRECPNKSKGEGKGKDPHNATTAGEETKALKCDTLGAILHYSLLASFTGSNAYFVHIVSLVSLHSLLAS